MDGEIAEEIAAVIAESLDKAWSQIDDISFLRKKDPSFQRFIYKYDL